LFCHCPSFKTIAHYWFNYWQVHYKELNKWRRFS
jgi:hypothetical protein